MTRFWPFVQARPRLWPALRRLSAAAWRVQLAVEMNLPPESVPDDVGPDPDFVENTMARLDAQQQGRELVAHVNETRRARGWRQSGPNGHRNGKTPGRLND